MKRLKKKNIIFIIVSALLAVVLIICGVYYGQLRNKVAVSVPSQGNGEASYFHTIMIGGYSDYLSKNKKAQLEEILTDTNNFYDDFHNQYSEPYYIDVKYENTHDGKTVITFYGKVSNSDTGELEPFEKVFTYDFILTEEIT